MELIVSQLRAVAALKNAGKPRGTPIAKCQRAVLCTRRIAVEQIALNFELEPDLPFWQSLLIREMAVSTMRL